MRSITKDELERLLEAPLKFKQNKITQLLDKIILEFLYSAGLKVSELVNLHQQDIDSKNNELRVGKEGRTRIIPISNQNAYWLRKYLDSTKKEVTNIFTRTDRASGKKDKNITPRSIQRLIKKYAKLAGINKSLTPQSLRQEFFSNLVEKGTNLYSIQELMGHSSINTTKIYQRKS